MFHYFIKSIAFITVSSNVCSKILLPGVYSPKTDYGSVTWGAASATNIERLAKSQKSTSRIILHMDYDTPSAAMFNDLDWLSVTLAISASKFNPNY